MENTPLSIHARIQADMVTALRDRDKQRRSALSFIASVLKESAVNNRVEELDDTASIALLQKQRKQRQETNDSLKGRGRDEDIAQNEYEIRLIEEYLPTAPTAEEVNAIVAEVITELGVSDVKGIGKVMAEVPKRLPAVDKGMLSGIVKAQLTR